MVRDWIAWHDEYEDPRSSLARRVEVVRSCLRDAFQLSAATTRPRRVISMCAGEGRDIIPVLARMPDDRVEALLVEQDRDLADRARSAAAAVAVRVTVAESDAGVTTPYEEFVPADVALVCGVLGNISLEDAQRTVGTLPSLLAPGGTVIWTRGRGADGSEPVEDVRRFFAAAGFRELALHVPPDARFRVGMHQLTTGPRPYESGVRMFEFL